MTKKDLYSYSIVLIFFILFIFAGPFIFSTNRPAEKVDDRAGAVVSPAFPTSLNDFSEGDVIEEEDWNAIEQYLGTDTSATSTSITYQLTNTSSLDPGHKHTSSSLQNVLATLNGSASSSQNFATSTATDTWTISSTAATHTITIPANLGFFTNDVGYVTSTASGITAINGLTNATTSLVGTANQVTVTTSSPNVITFATPQDLATSSAFTVATLDTGQGANELYDMDQNVLTTSNVTFGNVTSTAHIQAATLTTSGLATLNSLSLGTALSVANGGTGATTLTDHGVLIGSGTSAITPLAVGTNGQLLIGSSGADPVFATLNCDANLTCTTGAGTLEIDLDTTVSGLTNLTTTGLNFTNATGTGNLQVATLTTTGAFTVGGAINLNGNNINDVHELRTDSIPDTDHTANGFTTNSKNAGYSSAIGDLVFLGTNGKWLEADASTSTLASGMFSIALEATTDGNAMLVANPGSYVRDDSWSWNTGAILYASETLGAISEAVPTSTDSVVRVVGFAYTTTTIYFQPESGYITIE